MGEITFRAVIEVLGKPEEHVEKSIIGYLDKLAADKRFTLINKDVAETKKHDKSEMWAAFAEVEVKVHNLPDLTFFCFEYMPSIIEIIDPKKFDLVDADMNEMLNDLQARLHQVDMVAKTAKMRSDAMQNTISSLLQNYITLLLAKKSFTAEQLSKLTGMKEDVLADFLDTLIDKGKVDLKEGEYHLLEKLL